MLVYILPCVSVYFADRPPCAFRLASSAAVIILLSYQQEYSERDSAPSVLPEEHPLIEPYHPLQLSKILVKVFCITSVKKKYIKTNL